MRSLSPKLQSTFGSPFCPKRIFAECRRDATVHAAGGLGPDLESIHQAVIPANIFLENMEATVSPSTGPLLFLL